jgi:hypothetical protein
MDYDVEEENQEVEGLVEIREYDPVSNEMERRFEKEVKER